MAKEKRTNGLQDMITAGRERKKNEALAAKILGPNKKSNGINKRGASKPVGGSLASRIGDQGNALRGGGKQLAKRLETATVIPTGPKAMTRGRAAQAQPRNPGISIRGLAGPHVVMAENFAPGTTVADIKSAMAQVGGVDIDCRVIKTSPTVVAEVTLQSREDADKIIANFHNQKADGYVLAVYHKVGGQSANVQIPTGPRANKQRDDIVVDGTMGFSDPMDTDNSFSGGNGGRNGSFQGRTNGNSQGRSSTGGGLYSDSMVRNNGTARSGGGGGRNTRGGPGR